MAVQMEVMRVPAKLTLPEGVRIIRAPVRTRAGLGRGRGDRQGEAGRGMAQSGSASALGAEGRGFESLCPDHPHRGLEAPVAQADRASAF